MNLHKAEATHQKYNLNIEQLFQVSGGLLFYQTPHEVKVIV